MEETKILIRPIVTEKSLNQAALGWYTFAVDIKARKPQIKQAVAKAFSVKVLAVKTIVVKGKTKRVGRKMTTIKSSSWKKALVVLPKDQKIGLFETAGSTTESGLPVGKGAKE